jgi:hypothetical protein
MPVIIGERATTQIELFFVGFGDDIYMEPTPPDHPSRLAVLDRGQGGYSVCIEVRICGDVAEIGFTDSTGFRMEWMGPADNYAGAIGESMAMGCCSLFVYQ